MSQTGREVSYLGCIINSGKLEFAWSVITPSSRDWIGLYEDDCKENREWFDGHWFYISNHSSHSSLPGGRHNNTYSYANVRNPTFNYNYFEMNRVKYLREGLQRIFARHKKDWGFAENDNWNNQNGEKLQGILQEFIRKNINYIYRESYKDDNAYLNIVLIVYEDVLNEIANSEKPEDSYEIDYEKIKKKAEPILVTLEKLAV
ncbi:4625_t:CDS:2 [Entrophospora sp. SA101]|nr:4625_t:CDS:2 [Entrophospora sp. SA101]CAJ0833335.1 280_t:CDS:2 [Entrophospora sp. SA101]CAJ0842713.1 8747_t:CDS:2 [Entrophospora sp. SA101]